MEALDQPLSPVFQQNISKPELLTSRRVDLGVLRGMQKSMCHYQGCWPQGQAQPGYDMVLPAN